MFNAINVRWDPDAGYPDVAHGSSFVMVATWSDEGCPVDASALVTYGQSEDVTSPHVSDQTHEYSAKRFVPMRFCEADILADPHLTVTELSTGDDPARPGRGRAPVTPPAGPPDGRPPAHARAATVAAPLPTTGATGALLGLALLGGGLGLRLSRRG